MSTTLERYCPECDTDRSFWLVARTEVHLGTKRKWRCEECDYGVVQINDAVDTAAV